MSDDEMTPKERIEKLERYANKLERQGTLDEDEREEVQELCNQLGEDIAEAMRPLIRSMNSAIVAMRDAFEPMANAMNENTVMSNQTALDDRKRCDGCGTLFEPQLDGDLCPACVEIVIEYNLDPDDWEQHQLREEYGDG